MFWNHLLIFYSINLIEFHNSIVEILEEKRWIFCEKKNKNQSLEATNFYLPLTIFNFCVHGILIQFEKSNWAEEESKQTIWRTWNLTILLFISNLSALPCYSLSSLKNKRRKGTKFFFLPFYFYFFFFWKVLAAVFDMNWKNFFLLSFFTCTYTS